MLSPALLFQPSREQKVRVAFRMMSSKSSSETSIGQESIIPVNILEAFH